MNFLNISFFSKSSNIRRSHVTSKGPCRSSPIWLNFSFRNFTKDRILRNFSFFFPVSKLIGVRYVRFLLSIGWLSSLVVTLVCLRQFDIKSIVAYSSVVHMGMAVSGLFACSYTSSKAVYLICFSHGLSSPLIFYVLYIFYNNYNTRSILLLKGSNNSHPIKSIVVFLATVSAVGVPPLASFFSEIILNIGVLSFSFLFFTPSLLLFFFFGGLYNLFLCLLLSWGHPI